MKTQLVMFNTPIIVSDEEIKEGNWVIALDTFTIFNCNEYEATKPIKEFKHLYQKIIAGIEGLPKINWNGLEEEFGWVDVEKLANDYVNNNYPDYLNPKEKSAAIEDVIWGFKKAQSLNEKKFSLNKFELADLIRKSYLIHGNDSWVSIAKDVIENLSKPKVFEIEVEIEDYKSNGYSAPYKLKPKITNNSIKILRKL